MQQDDQIMRLGDIAALAQLQFQQDYSDIDPVIGINRQMRKQGFAVDILTIDCIVSKKRLMILFEDAFPLRVKYQASTVDGDPGMEFSNIALSELDQRKFYDLMVEILR